MKKGKNAFLPESSLHKTQRQGWHKNRQHPQRSDHKGSTSLANPKHTFSDCQKQCNKQYQKNIQSNNYAAAKSGSKAACQENQPHSYSNRTIAPAAQAVQNACKYRDIKIYQDCQCRYPSIHTLKRHTTYEKCGCQQDVGKGSEPSNHAVVNKIHCQYHCHARCRKNTLPAHNRGHPINAVHHKQPCHRQHKRNQYQFPVHLRPVYPVKRHADFHRIPHFMHCHLNCLVMFHACFLVRRCLVQNMVGHLARHPFARLHAPHLLRQSPYKFIHFSAPLMPLRRARPKLPSDTSAILLSLILEISFRFL